MYKNAMLLLVLLVTTTGFSAKANKGGGDFIIEPGIGYKEETLKLTTISNDLTAYSLKGTMASLKIGVQSSAGVSLLLVGEQVSGKAEIDPAGTDKPKFTHTIAGFQLGVSAMNTMKIYLGYAPMNKLEFKDENSFSGFTLSGQTYQAGIMFFPFRFIGLGVQYNINQYKQIEGANYISSKEVDDHFSKIDSQDISYSLSIML